MCHIRRANLQASFFFGSSCTFQLFTYLFFFFNFPVTMFCIYILFLFLLSFNLFSLLVCVNTRLMFKGVSVEIKNSRTRLRSTIFQRLCSKSSLFWTLKTFKNYWNYAFSNLLRLCTTPPHLTFQHLLAATVGKLTENICYVQHKSW